MSENIESEFDKSEILDVNSLVSDDSEIWLSASDEMPILLGNGENLENSFGFFIKKPEFISDVTLIRNTTQPELYESISFSQSSNELCSTTESWKSLGNQCDLSHSSLLARFQKLSLQDSQSFESDSTPKTEYKIKFDSELEASNENLSDSASENEYLTASSSLSDDNVINNDSKSNCNHIMASTPMTDVMEAIKTKHTIPSKLINKTTMFLNSIQKVMKENNRKLSKIKDEKLGFFKNTNIKSIDSKKPLINYQESNQIQIPINLEVKGDKKCVSKIPKISRIPKLQGH